MPQRTHTDEYDGTEGAQTRASSAVPEFIATQVTAAPWDTERWRRSNELWGLLEPVNKDVPEMPFFRYNCYYRIGRSDLLDNNYVLTDPRISEYRSYDGIRRCRSAFL